jgi:hypothetical protein
VTAADHRGADRVGGAGLRIAVATRLLATGDPMCRAACCPPAETGLLPAFPSNADHRHAQGANKDAATSLCVCRRNRSKSMIPASSSEALRNICSRFSRSVSIMPLRARQAASARPVDTRWGS